MSKDLKMLVCSDSHGSIVNMKRMLERHPEADMLLFLGDGLSDLESLRHQARCPMVYEIRGNCDLGWSEPFERLLDFNGRRILMTHGHAYAVKQTKAALLRAAKAGGADIALFGHTHCRWDSDGDGVRLLNPGSISRPVGGMNPAFIVLTVTAEGEISAVFEEIEE